MVTTSPGKSGWTPPLPAPAKLNLMLRIVGRRPDGYHLLQTVFQFLGWGDQLRFRPRRDGLVVLTRPLPGIPPQQDLCVRAARLLQAETGSRRGADIEVDKVLPMGGGLGGGSSDAATTLVALDRLWGTGLDRQELARLGLTLGADVPVFVLGQAAWAEGVGERLHPVTLPEPWYVVLLPDVHVATGTVFADAELTRDSKPIKITGFLGGARDNDCEAVVRYRYPRVAAALDWLEQQASSSAGAAANSIDGRHSRLTGTGACVYAEVADRARARRIVQRVPAPWRGFAVRGRNRSPLFEQLAEQPFESLRKALL